MSHLWQIEAVHLWVTFLLGHGLHLMKHVTSSPKGVRVAWIKTNLAAICIRLFVNALAFSYWMGHPGVATQMLNYFHLPIDLTLMPSHATAGMFGLAGDSLLDWLVSKVPGLNEQIPAVNGGA